MATELKSFRFDADVLQKFRDICKRRGDLSYHVNEAMRLYGPIQEEQAVKSPKSKKPKYDPIDLEFAEWMFTLITNIEPDAKKPNFESWAKDVRLMREIDNRTHHNIGVVWKWARGDAFWRGNILSASKLRQKFDQLSIQMKNKGVPNGQPKQSLSERSANNTRRALAQIENAGDILGSHDATLRLQVDSQGG